MSNRVWSYYAPLIILFLLFGFTSAGAQYSFDALRLAKQVPGQDAHSMALGSSSVSQLQGFGSYLVNPAVAARMSSSYFTAGVGVRDVSQESIYLNERNTFDDNQRGLTHIGFAYKVPTLVGSLVVGGGYAQRADYNSAYTVNAYNDLTSRTYQFLTDYSGDIAYNAFAIDDVHGERESVFEYGGFMGVEQYAETTRRGQSGEYSLFLATEFQEDLFMGLSLSIPVSNSEFQQVFIEESPLDNSGRPVYSGQENTGSYNIDQMLFEEQIRVDAVGLNARVGFLYSGLPLVDIGASYTTGTRWNVEENFDAFVQTRFHDVVTLDGEVQTDDDGEPYGPELQDEFNGEYSYSVTTPSRIHVGASTNSLPLVTLSASTERINYSSIRLREFDASDRETQISENNFINENFRDVWNYRAGAAITIFNSVEPRIGWAWMSNPVEYIEKNDRQFISAGVGIGLNQKMNFDFAVQYGLWETTEDIYHVDADTGIIVDDETGAPVTFYETADQEVERFHASMGVNIRF